MAKTRRMRLTAEQKETLCQAIIDTHNALEAQGISPTTVNLRSALPIFIGERRLTALRRELLVAGRIQYGQHMRCAKVAENRFARPESSRMTDEQIMVLMLDIYDREMDRLLEDAPEEDPYVSQSVLQKEMPFRVSEKRMRFLRDTLASRGEMTPRRTFAGGRHRKDRPTKPAPLVPFAPKPGWIPTETEIKAAMAEFHPVPAVFVDVVPTSDVIHGHARAPIRSPKDGARIARIAYRKAWKAIHTPHTPVVVESIVG